MKFKGIGTIDGTQKEIDIVADSPETATQQMKKMGYTNISIVEKGSMLLRKKVKTKDISMVFRQLAAFSAAGESFTKSLNSVADVTGNPTLKNALLDIRRKIETGQDIPAAFGEYKFFPKIVVNLLKVADSSGNMEVTLDEIARYLQQLYNIESGVNSAFIYPKVIIFIMLVAMSFITTRILPQFRSFYTDMNIDMPFITKAIYAFSDFLNNEWFIALPAVVALVYFVKNFDKYMPDTYDYMVINIPIIKGIMTHLYMFRFCKTMEILSNSEMDILETLSLTSDVMENHLFVNIIQETIQKVREGEGVTSSLRKNDKDKIFDLMTIAFLNTGEESSNIGGMMKKASEFYQRTINVEIEGFGKVIEPILLVIIAVFVFVLVSSVYLPIFKMSQIAGQH